MALVGLGGGGVFAHVGRGWVAQFDIRDLGAWLCLLNAVVILIALEVVLHIPVSLDVTGWNFGKLTVIYMVAAIPFFLTGLVFYVLFARSRDLISNLYGADLAGEASVCPAAGPVFELWGGANFILVAAAAMCGSEHRW